MSAKQNLAYFLHLPEVKFVVSDVNLIESDRIRSNLASTVYVSISSANTANAMHSKEIKRICLFI